MAVEEVEIWWCRLLRYSSPPCVCGLTDSLRLTARWAWWTFVITIFYKPFTLDCPSVGAQHFSPNVNHGPKDDVFVLVGHWTLLVSIDTSLHAIAPVLPHT